MWKAESDVATVPYGVDTFVIHDDKIKLQTVWLGDRSQVGSAKSRAPTLFAGAFPYSAAYLNRVSSCLFGIAIKTFFVILRVMVSPPRLP